MPPPWEYATAEEVNEFLNEEIIQVATGDFDLEGDEAGRVIRAYLSVSHISAATMDTWVDPATTPEIIRSIAGRMIACQVFGRAFSGNADEVSPYAQWLYNEAMSMLNGIITGTIVITELPDGVTATSHISEDYFYPNDSADALDAVKFRMRDAF